VVRRVFIRGERRQDSYPHLTENPFPSMTRWNRWELHCPARELDGKPTFIGDGVNIAGTVQGANYDDFVGTGKVVDRVFLVEDDAQIL
jgi:hypothetical protein